MLRSLGLFALVASTIALAWYDMGRPVPMPPSPLTAGEKLTCISYAPFHDQAPFTWDLHIPDRQIAGDLERLSRSTSCVRTYSAKGAQGRVTKLAAGMLLDMRFAPRCGAKTRSGTSCQAPAMPNGRCRMHGGPSPGAPKGNRNNWRHGHYSAEAIALRKLVRTLLSDARETFELD